MVYVILLKKTYVLKILQPLETGLPAITSIVLNDKYLSSGKVSFEFEFKSPYPIESPVIGIVVSDYIGNPIFGTNNRIHPTENNIKECVSGKMSLEINDVFLFPGSYNVSVYLGDKFTDIASYPDIVTFEYLETTIKSTQLPDAKYIGSIFLREVKWTYKTD